MDRVIKFRGLRVDGGGWAYGSLIIKGEQYFIVHLIKIKYRRFSRIREEYREVEVIPASVGQIIGLTDKNGKDIYEGDIIKTITQKHMVISWSKRFASYVIDRDGWAFSHWFGESMEAHEVEVVGNIHENDISDVNR